MKNTEGLNRLKKDIKENDIGNCYIFYGEETYLRDYYFRKIKEILVPEAFEEFNYRVFEGNKLDINELESAVDALPMMAARTMLVIKDFDFFKAAENIRNKIAVLLEDIPQYCCLIFVFDTIEYKADKRMKKLSDAVKSNACEVEFVRQKHNDMLPWIRRAFREYGKDIDKANSEYLLFLCGGLMTNLRSEIEKIASCAADKIISKKDIDTVATPTTEAVVFDLTDALARGDTDNAAQALTDLLALREEPVKLNSLICSQMRGLYLASLAARSGKTPAMLAEMMNYKSEYPARRLMESAKLRDANDWLEAVKLSAEADIEMKRTGVNRQAILTALVMRLGTVRA